MDTDTAGRHFRTAWIDAVTRHYPGTPKDGYVAPWEAMPAWERASAQAVAELVIRFVELSGGATARLTRAQRSQFVATCWLAQVHKHFSAPKPSYVAPWDGLPEWQRETNADIFDAMERAALPRYTKTHEGSVAQAWRASSAGP